MLPSVYGIGTAWPVVAFVFLLTFSTRAVGKAFSAMSQIEWWLQRMAGLVLVLVGVYLSLKFIFGIL